MPNPQPIFHTVSKPRSTRRWQVWTLLILLVAEVIGLAGLTWWWRPSAAEQLDRLYRVPTPLPPGEPGVPIRTWELPAEGINGSVYGMLYHSRSVRGEDTSMSGFLAIPRGEAPPGGRPIVALAHGTVGGADRCAPSRDPQRQQAIINPMLARGWIVAGPDFEGIGGSGPHPYLVGSSEARSIVDSVRAARRFIGAGASDRYVAWGLSQGGHAAMFDREMGPNLAPELKLLGAVALAPVSDLVGFVSKPPITPQAITLLAVSGYVAAYPNLRADDVLDRLGLSHLEDVEKECLYPLNASLPDTPLSTVRKAVPADIPTWNAALTQNDPGRTPSLVPVLLVQGTDDPIVPPDDTVELFGRLCARGAAASLELIPGASHGNIATARPKTYLDWIESRFLGEPDKSNCQPGR